MLCKIGDLEPSPLQHDHTIIATQTSEESGNLLELAIRGMVTNYLEALCAKDEFPSVENFLAT